MIAIVVEAALRSSVLMLSVWLMLRVLRVRDPAVERIAWIAVLLASIAMPLAMNALALPVNLTASVTWLPDASVGAMTVSESSIPWAAVVLAAYATISAALCARQLVGLIRLWQVRNAATKLAVSTDDVRASRAVSSPATVFSAIVVPEDFACWSALERDAALAHERKHVANRDFYVQALAQLHRHLFWFNPLAWWLPRRLALLSEHISDDAAIDSISARVAYAELLLSFARKSMHDEQVIAMARPSTLASRIERILGNAALSTGTSRWKIIAIGAVLVPLATIAATLKADQEPARHSTRLDYEPLAQQAGHEPTTQAGKIVLPRSNPARPLSQPIYPPVSRRLHEAGTVVLKLHVLEDGSVGDAAIEKSSGYPDLDYAAMYESFRWKLDPGTVDGQAQRMWGKFAVTFKLSK